MSKRASLAPLAGILAVVWASPAAALERHITLSPGERLRIVGEGEGTPVVLLPGLLGSAFGFRKLVGPLVAGGPPAGVIDPLGTAGPPPPPAAPPSPTPHARRPR